MAGARRVPVAVLGATGYVGAELLRILSRHPGVELVFVSSEQYRGQRASDVHPALAGYVDLVLEAPDPDLAARRAEAVFTALPHGASAPVVAVLRRHDRLVIDQSADFRLRDLDVYAKWYGAPHPAPAPDALVARAYADEPCIVLRGAEPPTIREVRGTNRCAIGWRWDAATGYAVVMTTLDNLGKGAAGQGVQCMNLALGLPETQGL